MIARVAITAITFAILAVTCRTLGYAQYVPIPNYTGIGAGAEFRGDVNNHLSGVTAIAPRLVPLAYAQLPAEQDGQLYWCKDCVQATLCAAGGSGALAIGTKGQWSCSSGGGGSGASPGGSNGALQYNNSSAFGGASNTSVSSTGAIAGTGTSGQNTITGFDVNHTCYPAAHSNSSDIGAQVNACIAAYPNGARIIMPPGAFSYSTTIQFPISAGGQYILQGAGRGPEGNATLSTVLNYTGTGTAIDQTIASSGNQNSIGAQFRDFHLNGASAGSSAIGVSFGGTIYTDFRNVTISGFQGIGVEVHNKPGMFTERYFAEGLDLYHNRVGWKWLCDNGCNNSFEHFNLDKLYMNIYSTDGGAVGFETVSSGSPQALIDDSTINVNGNMEGTHGGDTLFETTTPGDNVLNLAITAGLECDGEAGNCVAFKAASGTNLNPLVTWLDGHSAWSNSPSNLIPQGWTFGDANHAQQTWTAQNMSAQNIIATNLNGSVNDVINVQSAQALIANTSSTYLPLGAIGDGNNDDTAAIQNAILAACGMTSLSSGQMYVHYGHPRVTLPYTGAQGCYKITQPLRAFCSALDLGSDPGGSNVGGAHATLCPTFAGPAVIAEGPGYYLPSYSTSLLSGPGNSFVSNGSSPPIVLSDWLNSAMVNINNNTALGIEMEVNLSAVGDGNLFYYTTAGPGSANTTVTNGVYLVQMTVDSGGHTRCGIVTTNQGFVGATSSDTGFSLNANHDMSWDWDGSNLRCFRDGTLIVGPLTATGNFYTAVSNGLGLFNTVTIPDVNIGQWPDQAFNNGSNEPVGKFDAINISKVALHTAAYTPSTSKPSVNSNTQLIVNFPSVCSSVGQSGCSTDGTVLGQTYTGIVASGNVYLPLRTENYGTTGGQTTQTPSIHLHDLELCGTKNINAVDGLFAIWSFDLELDHLSCSSANDIGLNLYSNEWNSSVHDIYIGGTNHRLGVEFGNAYNQSHDWNINDNGGMVATVSLGSSGGQDDEFFQHDGAGISVYDWMYETTSFTAMDFSTDDGGSEPNHLSNFYINGESAPGVITGGFQQLLGSSAIPITEWSGAPTTLMGVQFAYDGAYPSYLINHADANSNTHLPVGPDTLINVQIPENGGNPAALSNPSGWALDLGDQNGGDTKAIYHGTVGSGAQSVPAGAANLDGHTFRVSDGSGTAATPTCTAGSTYAGAAGTGRCEVSWKNSASAYVYTGVQW